MGYAVTDDEGRRRRREPGIARRARITCIAAARCHDARGQPQFDNYRRVGNDRPRFTTGTGRLRSTTIRRRSASVWLATDRVYRAASQRLIRLKARREAARAGERQLRRFFEGSSRRSSSRRRPDTKFNPTEWATRLRKLSARVHQVSGRAELRMSRWKRSASTKTLVTTEGTASSTAACSAAS